MLCHDITRIVRGVVKDVAFRKGHIVTAEDIPALLALGKEHLFVWEAREGMLHENDAAQILYNICAGENVRAGAVKEGKIDIFATCDGVFTVDKKGLLAVNSLGEMIISTRHGGFAVKRGEKLAGTRVIPLVIALENLDRARGAAGPAPLLAVRPFGAKKVAVITTGNEVFRGRIADSFTPVVVDKVREFGADIHSTCILPDEPADITQAILSAIKRGADMVLCTGGMSVDPDDRTPLAIKNTGAAIVSYGAPALPGAMFLLAYLGGSIPVLGLPGCVMYSRRTVFDLVLPRLMADIRVSAADLAALGHGGLCLECEVCTFPNCGFGKGN